MVEQQGKISVIVPIYNKELYIRRCIESIINQSYKNIKIILINDGSTDKSKEICEEYAKKDSRIILINTKNKGAGNARNTGLDMATGEYISIIDADDFISVDYYDTLYKMIIETKSDMAECRHIRKNPNEDLKDIINHTFKIITPMEKILILYGKNVKDYTNSVIVPNKLYKKKLFNNIRYPLNRVIDDEFITYKLICASNSIAVTEDIMYAYVQSKNSIMRIIFKEDRVFDTIDAYNEVVEFFKDSNSIELKRLILIRYIDYCTELSVQIYHSKAISEKRKKELYHFIKENFKEKNEIFNQTYHKDEEYEKSYKLYYDTLNDDILKIV